MFRPLRRVKNLISEDDAKNLLKTEKRAVLAMNGDDGYPYAIPVNFYYNEESNRIYFHGAKAGHKVDSIKKDSKVCFTVYGNEFTKEGEWAPFVQSAVVFGRCRLMEQSDLTYKMLYALAMKYYPGVDEVEKEMDADYKRAQLYEIEVEHISGKQIQER